jgi:hypothetical protein
MFIHVACILSFAAELGHCSILYIYFFSSVSSVIFSFQNSTPWHLSPQARGDAASIPGRLILTEWKLLVNQRSGFVRFLRISIRIETLSILQRLCNPFKTKRRKWLWVRWKLERSSLKNILISVLIFYLAQFKSYQTHRIFYIWKFITVHFLKVWKAQGVHNSLAP